MPSLLDAALDLLIDGAEGIWHLSAGEVVTWADFARRIASACRYDPASIRPVEGATLGWRALRPRYVPLASERGLLAPVLDRMIVRFAEEYRLRDPIYEDRLLAANDLRTPGGKEAS